MFSLKSAPTANDLAKQFIRSERTITADELRAAPVVDGVYDDLQRHAISHSDRVRAEAAEQLVEMLRRQVEDLESENAALQSEVDVYRLL